MCPGAASSHVGGLSFVVLHTKGGAVRWFKVSPRRRSDARPTALSRDGARAAVSPLARRVGRAAGRCAVAAALPADAAHSSLHRRWPLQICCRWPVLAWPGCRARRRQARGRCSAGLRHRLASGGTWWLFITMHLYGGLPAPLAALAVPAAGAALALYWRAAWRACARWRAAAPAGRRAAFAAALAAGRAGARRAVHRLSLGRRRLCACRRTAGGAGALDRRLRHRLRGGAGWRRCVGAARWTHRRAPGCARCGARWRAACSARALAGRLHARPSGALERDAAAGQRPAGREVRGRAGIAAGAGLVPRAQLDARARRWWSRPKRRFRCCPSSCPRLLERAARALCQRRPQAALIGMPLGRRRATATPTRWSACRPQRPRADALPLRQAPSGAVRRVHPARFQLVHAADEHPAGRLQPRPARRAVFAVGGQRVAPNICYEDLFGEELAARFVGRATARRRSSSTSATSPGSATRSRSTSTCRSPACARWSSSGRCCAPPTPAPRPSSTIAAGSPALPRRTPRRAGRRRRGAQRAHALSRAGCPLRPVAAVAARRRRCCSASRRGAATPENRAPVAHAARIVKSATVASCDRARC